MNNTSTRRFELTAVVAGIATALAAIPGAAEAQQAQGSDAEPVLEEIVVRGIRRSLQSSLSKKRNSVGVIDVVTARDINRFPDENVAEALQRLPGISITRDKGEGKLISVRGLAPAFSPAVWNGREVASGRTDTAALTSVSSGAGRSFAFNVLPSEVIGGLTVHKTLTPDLVEGGIGGLVEIETRKPLDLKERVISTSFQGQYDAKSDSVKPRIAGLFSDTYADDTIGVLFGAVYSERVLREDQLWAWGWFRNGIDDLSTPGVDYPDGIFPWDDGSTFVEQESNRFGITSAFEYQPTDNFRITLDGFYTEFDSVSVENHQSTRWTIDNFSPFKAYNVTVDPATGGLLTASFNDPSGANNIPIQISTNNEVFELDTKTLAVGGNLQWNKGPFDLALDVAYSEARSDSVNYYVRFTGGFQVEYNRAIGADLPNYVVDRPQTGAGLLDPASFRFLDSWYRKDPIDDEVFQTRLDASYNLGSRFGKGMFTSIDAGVRLSTRKKAQDDRLCGTCNDILRSNITTMQGLPLARSLAGDYFANESASLIRDMAFPDSKALFEQYGLFSQPLENFTNVYTIEEDTVAAYVKANLDFSESFAPLSGNIGVRLVRTKSDATGELPNRIRIERNVLLERVGTFSTVGRTYDYVLPSLTLRYDVADNVVVRGSIARSLTRPELDKLSPRLSFDLADPPTASSGNPLLDPFTAWNFDLSAEWYISDLSAVSVALFRKDIDGFVFSSTRSNEEIAGQVFAVVTRPQNAASAQIDGIEIAMQQDFGFLAPLDGFGALLNVTLLDSSTEFDAGFNSAGRGIQDFEGLSDFTANAVLFYEKERLSARVAYNYRSDYLETRNFIFSARSVDGFGQLDASFAFRLKDNWSLFVEGVALNNPRQLRFDDGMKGLPSTVIDTQYRILFGIRGTL